MTARLRAAMLVLAALASLPAWPCDVSEQQLQRETLAFLKKEYPARTFTPGKTVDVIVTGKMELGLQNLLSKMCLPRPSPDAAERQKILRAHFDPIMSRFGSSESESDETVSWADARDHVLLQFMPSDYFEKLGTVGVTRPFVPGVVLAVVVDSEQGYASVGEKERKKWNIEAKALMETALKNLDQQHKNVKMEGSTNGADRFLAIEEKDGYDAVRLLVPWVRQEAAKALGDPFYAAIANRDFLIMWSEKNTAKFHEFTRKRAREDFNAQPYPLTPATLRVWANGRVEVARD